jgi:hypothetical protein
MVATNWRAASRGSWVSVSSVITYFTDNEGKAVAFFLTQQQIQIRQLAALALVTHPDPVVRVPAARAMEQEEHVVATLGILRIQRFDLFSSQGKQRHILDERFLGRIGKVGQKAEMQIRVAIGQKPDFQRFDQTFDALATGEHCRNHRQRT